MRFGVLGPLAVWDGDGEAVRVPETKVRMLLADLLVHEGHMVTTDRLISDLWGERPPADPANALQVKISQLRRVVGKHRVLRVPGGYRLPLEAEELDAARFQALLRRAGKVSDARGRTGLLTEALGLWRGGKAYADLADEEFALPTARYLEEQRLAALEEQAEARLSCGEHIALADELTAQVTEHPLRERLRASQLRALCRAGRRGEALTSYRELRELLGRELGVEPGPELVTLYESLLRGRPTSGAASGPAPARPEHDAPRHNLPAPLTPLVGRDRAVDQVCGLLHTARLVTLTGPGGVGKTRLSIETARRLVGAFPDGVWLVELGTRRGSVTELSEQVAAALGLGGNGASETPAGTPRPAPGAWLSALLRERDTLIVLDNCEQSVDEVAELVTGLLQSVPGLRLLVTSREALHVAGEVIHPVEPLPLADAVELFTARATAAAPGFALDATNAAAVAVICRRLDGVPLALELAATRVRTLGMQGLADRLDDRFRLLTGGRRGAPARQQTLRAVIDWSWELLTDPERITLRRLTVHADGCTLEAAEAVCAGAGLASHEVVGLLGRLIDRSLIVTTEGPDGVRYRLLESVAAYGAERLAAAGEVAAVRRRHRQYHVAFAERAAQHLRGPGQRRWLLLLDTEGANLRAALDSAVTDGNPDDALRLSKALSWYWMLRGRVAEARRFLTRALASCADRAPAEAAGVTALNAGFALLAGERVPMPPYERITDPVVRARVRWFNAYAHFHAGDVAESERITGEALAAFQELEDDWGIAAALALRSVHALMRSDLTALRKDSEQSTAMFRSLEDRWGQLRGLASLATLAEITGAYQEAADLLHDGLRMAQELGLATEVSSRLSSLGRIALLTGHHDEARALHERARRLAAEQSFRFGEVHAEIGLALGARRSGDLRTAEHYLTRIRAWYRQITREAANPLVLAELGFVAEVRGDAEATRTLHQEGLEGARAVADPRGVALASEGLAGAEMLHGRGENAALLLGAATAARAAVGAPLPWAERHDVTRITTAALAALGEERFARAHARGHRMSLEEALAHTGLAAPAAPRIAGEHPAAACCASPE
ncbi:BTAD domain-containing putative transcriptional regulator [Streptomyces catenulae]|uniref:BTAD domain-containing putative transcriptional regulator n=1 Tax=Streptomyces catenulae TaxID=66875 RepID=A0ABV2Z1W4_9ACTN|nr:BTAD domain-containing putative transcriptional regulator [Streptomyces catenulae]